MKINLDLVKKISFIASTALIFFVGLFFLLFTDLYLHSTSPLLFAGIALTFGSGACFVLAESFRHKKWLFILLKAVALALVIGFVVFAICYRNFDIYASKTFLKLFKRLPDGKLVFFLNKVQFKKGIDIEFTKDGWFISMIVFACIALATQAYNFIHNLIFGIEE